MRLAQCLAWLLSLLVPAALSAGDESRRPNVVVIVADDLGYGDLSCHGGKDIPTPHIDSIAGSGVQCTNGYVSGPYCSPTRAALLTGRYQQRFGHEFNPGPPTANNAEIGLSLTEVTLADRLKAAGYATGMVGKWHLGHVEKFYPQRRGFEEFFGFLGGAHGYFPGVNPNDPIRRGSEPVDEKEYLTDAFRREAVAFIEKHKEHPFFLYLTFNAVHSPLHAKEDVLKRFGSIADERRRKYAAMLSSMDDAVGAVLGKIDETQLDKDTLVFFISDNGGPPGNGSTNTPLSGQKATTWEGGIRVPFLVKWPGQIPAGMKYEHPVIQLDILPTALAAARASVSADAKVDGVNLLPHFRGDVQSPPHDALYWRFGEQMAIRQGNWKLIRTRGDTAPRLYDLAADIGEKNDLAGQNTDVTAKLQTAWNEWSATLQKPEWGAPRQGAKKKKRVQ